MLYGMASLSVRELVRRDALLYVVFGTGAAVLAVEVMAVRILSPYFGNTIFAFSSVISVILAALSLGYWYGGRRADRLPDEGHFYLAVFFSGLSVLILHVVGGIVLPLLAFFLPVTYGPLVAATLLFFPSAFLFGILSPYVIALRARQLPERGIGTVSGEVFFWSTLGSIVGSLLSGFVLVPMVGINLSMVALASLIALVGLVGYAREGHVTHRWWFVFAVALVANGGFLMRASDMQSIAHGTTLYTDDGYYERLSVWQGDFMGQEGRVLLMDRSAASGIALPEGGLLFPYTTYYELYRFYRPGLSQVLILGAGAGTVATTIHKAYPEASIDLVDVEPKLFTLAHRYFGLPVTDAITEHTVDGRQFLLRNDDSYDLIFGDMYATLYSIPWHANTREFYQLLFDRLAPDGVYVGNYIGALELDGPSLLGGTLATIHAVFGNVSLFAVESPESAEIQNLMVVAHKGNSAPVLSSDSLHASADESVRRFAPHFVAVPMGTVRSQQVFTDDLTPSEVYLADLLRRHHL